MKTFALIVLLPLIAVNAKQCAKMKARENSSASTSQTSTSTTSIVTSTGTSSVPDTTVVVAGNKTDSAAPKPMVADTNAYRLVVSFASKGSGIDYKTKEVFVQWLKDYRPVVSYDEIHWGREGEVDLCLKLSELSTKDQERFVKDARIQLDNKELIFVTENTVCIHKR